MNYTHYFFLFLFTSVLAKTENIDSCSDYKAQPFDILINEILFDPDEVTILPDTEYIELYNRTNYPINLKNWLVSEGIEDKSPMEITTGCIAPKGYFLISKGDFSNYGINFKSNKFPTLNNTGEELSLTSASGTRIHAVHFSTDFYNDNTREDGFAIELIDPNNPCEGKENWKASQSNIGGTPGTQNSVFAENIDNTKPFITNTYPLSANQVHINFSEQLDSTSLHTYSNYSFLNHTIAITEVYPYPPLYQAVDIKLSDNLDSTIIYQMKIKTEDCAANFGYDTVQIALPHAVDVNSKIVISEILFNPISGGSDYLEIINLDNKAYNLNSLRLASLNNNFGVSSNYQIPSYEPKILFPNNYYVLTENPNAVLQNYTVRYPYQLIEINDLPTLADNEGGIGLFSDSLRLLDSLYYYDDYHLAALSSDEKEGISLERIDLRSSSSHAFNWASASSSANFGTPTTKNSQQIITETKDNNFEPRLKVFSPDEDGIEDIMSFPYSFDEPNYIINAIIFNPIGVPIKHVANNLTISTEGIVTWDGTKNDGNYANIGVYILYVEAFNPNGKMKQYKHVFVLGGEM